MSAPARFGLAAFVVVASSLASSFALAASTPPRRPNLIVLLADDLRADALGAYGGRGVSTPNLDRLAHAGTVFERAYIMGGDQPAVCTPSRAMLWTGRHLFRLKGGIPADAPLLGGVLRQGGYDTYGVGKWHNERPAFNRAFADGARIFFGGMSSQTAVPTWDYDPSARYPKGAERVGAQHSSELFTDAAIAAIEARAAGKHEQPFLLYVAFTSPHDPRQARERFVRLHDPARASLPRNFLPQHPFDNGELDVRDELLAPRPRTPEAVRRHVADYRAMVSDLDHEVGRILGAVDRTGHGEDTVVVFASDNGLALGSHGLLGKQNLYEHSVRVPLIVRGPGIPRGQRARGLAYLLDLFPTLCELAGAPLPEGLDGQSLAPMLRSPTRAKGRPSLFFAYRREQRAVRDERWKLIEYAVAGAKGRQLFDLLTDPDERRDLSGDSRAAAHLTRLARELAAWRTRLADPAMN
jgi:arylsulfatase A-like enzyme